MPISYKTSSLLLTSILELVHHSKIWISKHRIQKIVYNLYNLCIFILQPGGFFIRFQRRWKWRWNYSGSIKCSLGHCIGWKFKRYTPTSKSTWTKHHPYPSTKTNSRNPRGSTIECSTTSKFWVPIGNHERAWHHGHEHGNPSLANDGRGRSSCDWFNLQWLERRGWQCELSES